MNGRDVPRMSGRAFRWSLWIIRAAGVIITLWLLMYAYSQTVPYEPYRVEGYQAVPNEVCPGGSVRVDLTRFADPDGRIQSITTRTSWQDVNTEATPGVQEYVTVWDDRNDVQYGTETVPSNILREIPEDAGEYRIVSEYDVRGRVLLFDRVDRYQVRSESILTVLNEGECDD